MKWTFFAVFRVDNRVYYFDQIPMKNHTGREKSES